MSGSAGAADGRRTERSEERITRILATPLRPPDPEVLAQAARALRSGDVVGIPTDTVYGLAVDPWQPGATGRIFALKGRPRDVVLAVLVADEAQVSELTASVGDDARRLMEAWWPGPLTLVLDRRAGLGADLGVPGSTIGIRCPDHVVARTLASAVGPLATTSANRHGQEPATTAAAVAQALHGVPLVVDAGPCARRPSTVVDCTTAPVRVLRDGPIGAEQIQACVQGDGGRGP